MAIAHNAIIHTENANKVYVNKAIEATAVNITLTTTFILVSPSLFQISIPGNKASSHII